MTRYLLGALVAIAVIGAVGYLVYSRSFASAPAADQPAPTSVAPPPTGPSATAEPAPAVRISRVAALTGRVEKRAGTQWIELHVSEELTAQDTIRTAAGGRATLDVGGIVEVDDLTELTVGEISATLAQLALTEGRVTASASDTGTTLRISTRDTDAVAETARGKFDVLSSGKGQVTVAASAGDVKVTAKGATVVVPAGTLSTVQAGAAPSAPRPIPPSLFLKVSAAAQARDKAALRGEATPGAVVSINGVRTAADEQGKFTSEVPLRLGSNTIIVSVEDATGRRERRVIQRTVGTTTPRLEAEVEWK